MIKTIIFDFDGVIHDTFELAYNINKQIDNSLTSDEYKDFFNGNIYDNKKVTKDAADRFFKLQNEEFEKLRINKEIKKELLKLKERFDLFIITSNMESTLKNYFENNGIMHIFKEVLGIETSHLKVEKFKYLINKYHLNKDNCIFVTDTLGDILEANKVDLNTIAVDYGFHGRKRLAKGNPIKIISDFGDLAVEIDNLK